MATEKSVNMKNLYSFHVKPFLRDIQYDGFYAYFMQAVNNDDINVSLYQNYIERRIDMRWVQAIEKAIIPLDAIVRNPIRNIRNEEDILPIEQARQITTESVKHLAQHTNLIQSVQGDMVTPQKILNVRKEETFDVYENRFIYTLITQLDFFIDKRIKDLFNYQDVSDKYKIELRGESNIGQDSLTYDISISYESPHQQLEKEDTLINADISNMSNMQRIERLRKIIYDFRGSPLMRNLAGAPLIRPPLKMTNVLTKNQNFKQAVELWIFIESYTEKGFTVEKIEQTVVPSNSYVKDLVSTLALQYCVIKTNNSTEQNKDINANIDYIDEKSFSGALSPVSLSARNKIEEIMKAYNIDIDEARKIFDKELDRKNRRIKLEKRRINSLFDRVVLKEEGKLDKELKELEEIHSFKESKSDTFKAADSKLPDFTNQIKKFIEERGKTEKENEKNVVELVSEEENDSYSLAVDSSSSIDISEENEKNKEPLKLKALKAQIKKPKALAKPRQKMSLENEFLLKNDFNQNAMMKKIKSLVEDSRSKK